MSHPIPNSSLSKQVVKLSQSDGVLALGESLVQELNLDKSVDTLGRWMAHYIAELIDDAKNAEGEDAARKQQICCGEILKLWAHRHSLPNGKGPFQELEGLEGVLRKLDPENSQRRYFPEVRRPKTLGQGESDAVEWFDAIEEVDRAARTLLGYCLSKSAEASIDKSQEWVSLAQAAGEGDSEDVSLVRLFFGDDSAFLTGESNDVDQNKSDPRIEQLEALIKHAQAALDCIRDSGVDDRFKPSFDSET